MIVDVSTVLPVAPEKVEAHLKTPRLLVYVAAPLVKFAPCNNMQFPEIWGQNTYWVSLRLFGFIPVGQQAVVVSYPETTRGFSLRDNGYSSLVKKWDHRITIEPAEGGTLYRDHVTIEAGILTVFVWAFARVFYRHRQHRWRQLIANDFDYTAA